MKRASIRVQEPTPELIEKIRRARVAISQQKPRYLKCPYCQHNAIAVYEDTRGHVESKCKKCGRITVFDVLNMRRLARAPSKNQRISLCSKIKYMS